MNIHEEKAKCTAESQVDFAFNMTQHKRFGTSLNAHDDVSYGA